MGRGARNQRDPFHQQYLDRKDELREQYVLCRTHQEKRHIQEMLLAWVEEMNGQFVEEHPLNKRAFQIVTDHTKLLKKVAQALREPRKIAHSPSAHAAIQVPSEEAQFSIPHPIDIVSSGPSGLDSFDDNIVTDDEFDFDLENDALLATFSNLYDDELWWQVGF